ncbi:uncharacterized protein BO97DRAFT_407867 [Aspergillus homomorphus CBS 101889]|uniref:Uncharacterized protein n=1 Tax=Aspergillus homomorphus (strain CBS 101889) TaxID=1450537 RepID=A0A395HQK3_ASPHC|nr:hypothetical protein BO97DRAFT_407867 [Aspergillus homomorphus CBS 101889]RAL09138.1 hypothetical protein BO97DRAFT_407867 [Aspergillus homomorphus CBS 101889]
MSTQRPILRLTNIFSHLKPFSRRYTSTSPPPPPPPAPKNLRARLQKFNDRLPPFMRAYTTPLLGAPATHVTSFLILHEFTAIVPIVGLMAAFHYGNWLPDLTASESFQMATQRFQRWLRKKGWADADTEVDFASLQEGEEEGPLTERAVAGSDTQMAGVRLVLEYATAYTVVKFLLPLRIAASVWATPWFARVVFGPLRNRARAIFGKK